MKKLVRQSASGPDLVELNRGSSSVKNLRVSSKLRLKPSQILDEAKREVKFGSRHQNRLRADNSSLAIL